MLRRQDSGPTRLVSIAADVTLVIIAIAMLALTWNRKDRSPSVSLNTTEAPSDWRNEVSTGLRWGPRDAPLIIVEFIDFQCPFCARWAARVDSLVAAYPQAVQIVTHHFPIASHPFALPAAIAVECADRQGANRRFQTALFREQNLLGTKKWEEFATIARVTDIEDFTRCISMPVDSFPRIAYGRKLGERIGVRGTPTIWVNGQVDRPSFERLGELVKNLTARRP